MQNSKAYVALGCLLFSSLVGCGKWPAIVDSPQDVTQLSTSTTSIRARGLSDDDISSLARLQRLTILDFSSGSAVMPAKIGDDGLKTLSELNLPNLDTLTLGNCTQITDAGLRHLGKMHTVTWLSLMACPGITDEGLPSLSPMKKLTALDLRGCPGITDKGLKHLATKSDWNEILLGGCINVTDAGVAELQAALPNAAVQKDEQEWSEHKKTNP